MYYISQNMESIQLAQYLHIIPAENSFIAILLTSLSQNLKICPPIPNVSKTIQESKNYLSTQLVFN